MLPAAPCNRILAQPGTITGSIGVIFMKLNLKEALAEYGVSGDVVSFGDNADWASGLHALTSKQRQQVRTWAYGSCTGVAFFGFSWLGWPVWQFCMTASTCAGKPVV